MKKPNKVLTMPEIADWLTEFSPVTPTHQEVEDAVYSLIENGILEPLWGADGVVSYRLTDLGNMVADVVVNQGDM